MNEIMTFIAIIISLIGLYIGIKVYLHSHRNVKFELDEDCYEKISHRVNADQFSTLIDLPFSLLNMGAKRLVIEKIVLEKKIHVHSLPETNVNLSQNFYVIYHFFVSEETLLSKKEIIYGSDGLEKRKYNILDKEIELDPSDKKTFKFKVKDYFRHMFYYFDGKICSFMISDLYAIDTLGNKYSLDKKYIELLRKASHIDCEAVLVLINDFEHSKKMRDVFLYHIHSLYNSPKNNKSFSSMAFNRYLSIKEKDAQEELNQQFDEMMPENEFQQKDDDAIKNSLFYSLSSSEIKEISKNIGGLININKVRDYMILETKNFKKSFGEKHIEEFPELKKHYTEKQIKEVIDKKKKVTDDIEDIEKSFLDILVFLKGLIEKDVLEKKDIEENIDNFLKHEDRVRNSFLRYAESGTFLEMNNFDEFLEESSSLFNTLNLHISMLMVIGGLEKSAEQKIANSEMSFESFKKEVENLPIRNLVHVFTNDIVELKRSIEKTYVE